jgi:hypothetical protein
MPVSRRTFLGSAAASWLGLTASARAGLIDTLRERNRQRIDERVAEHATPVDGCGYLDQPAFAIDNVFRGPQVPYAPQPGDLFFSITVHLRFRVGHALVGAFQPSHSGIIFRRPDGSMAFLEAGSFDVPLIKVSDLVPILSAYRSRERVWIRRRAVPLTEEQSCRLTAACLAQDGKPFARVRIYNQITPFRDRGPLKTFVAGGPHGTDRTRYYCAELVTEMIVAAGLICPADTRPSATYPHDLFFDESFNPFLNRHFKLGPHGWCPPAQWRPHVCGGGCGDEPNP